MFKRAHNVRNELKLTRYRRFDLKMLFFSGELPLKNVLIDVFGSMRALRNRLITPDSKIKLRI